jgi:outer membrane protein assembly factor BamB
VYDTELREWLWDRKHIAPPERYNSLYFAPEIFNNKIYAAIDCSIVCHDLSTGEQLWKRDFTNDFTFSGFIIEDGRLIANNEDLFTVCLDAETGAELWLDISAMLTPFSGILTPLFVSCHFVMYVKERNFWQN